LPNYLYPIPVWIFGKSDLSHSTVGELFLERIASIFYPFTGGLNVIHTDANVSEASSRVGVTVRDRVVRIGLLERLLT
jgi:acyl dehydratase